MNLGRQFTFTVPRCLTKTFLSDSALIIALCDASQDDFNGFMDDFTCTYQLYGSIVDDADIATRTQGTTYLPCDEDRDPTLEVEALRTRSEKATK